MTFAVARGKAHVEPSHRRRDDAELSGLNAVERADAMAALGQSLAGYARRASEAIDAAERASEAGERADNVTAAREAERSLTVFADFIAITTPRAERDEVARRDVEAAADTLQVLRGRLQAPAAVAPADAAMPSCAAALMDALPPDGPAVDAERTFATAEAAVASIFRTQMTRSDLTAFRALLDVGEHEIARRFGRFGPERRARLLAILADPKVRAYAAALEASQKRAAPVQAKPATDARRDQDVDTHAVAQAGVAGPAERLPHLDAIQRSFGSHDVGGVRAHVGGEAAHAAATIGAEAYATGNSVAFASSPSLFTAAHEAAHVVQQRAGVQLLGGVGDAGDRYEQQADAVAARVVRGESAEDLLGEPGGSPGAVAIQRKDAPPTSEQVDATIAENSRALGLPIPPVVVDHMLTGTAAIREFVVRHLANGTRADGKTYFYRSRAEMAAGVQPHLARFGGVDAEGRPVSKTDAQLQAEARQSAAENVAVTMTPTDNTIHINIGDEDHNFRVILHEAVHQHTRTHADGLGFGVNEGVAEYISELVLGNYGIAFTPAAVYRDDYAFVRSLVDVFGEQTVLRFALADGAAALKAEFTRYAADPAATWKRWSDAVRARHYGKARELLDDYMMPIRDELREDDARAEAANERFWDEANAIEAEQADERERGTWPPEASRSIDTVVVAVRAAGNWSAVTVPKGGRHGVRQGWLLAFGPDTDLYPSEYLLTEVKKSTSVAIVPRPVSETEGVATKKVTLRRA